eukprot:tig00020704_g13160.t1
MSCICTREYAPVCVKNADGTWQEYSNFCGMRCSHKELDGKTKEETIKALNETETRFMEGHCPAQPILASNGGSVSAASHEEDILSPEGAAAAVAADVPSFECSAELSFAEAEAIAGADDPWDVNFVGDDLAAHGYAGDLF